MKLKKLIMMAAFLTTSLINANSNDIELGYPNMRGSGCANGSTDVTLTNDKQSLSILFSDFVVEAGRNLSRTTNRKRCDIAIPVHIPQGLSVSLLKVDYRGFVDLPSNSGAMARFSAEYFFAGAIGPKVTRTFRAGYSNDYVLTDRLRATALVWSRCGADVILRVKSGMMVRNRSFDDAMATVDSVDVKAGIKFKLQWKRCSN